jgi:hypothetical protein
MPGQQPSRGGFDFSGVFDSQPASSTSAFDFSGVFPASAPSDNRSVVTRALDWAVTPLVSQQSAHRMVGAAGHCRTFHCSALLRTWRARCLMC